MAFRAGPTQHKHDRSLQMKWFCWIGGGVLVVVVFAVLFVPVLREHIEGSLLGWLSRNAQ